MTSKPKAHPARVLISIFLIGGIIFSSLGYSEKALDYLGLSRLSQINDRYLESSFQRSLKTFGTLSTLKIGLAVIEGSEIGVGFGLEVGDVVQSAYDYVDTAWRTVFASSIILMSTRYFLQTADLIDQWFLLIALVSVSLMLLLQWVRPLYRRLHHLLRDISILLTLLTVSLYLILPLSVTGGAYLSQYITAPSIEKAETGISDLKKDLFPDQQNKNERTWPKWWETKERINTIITYLNQKSTALIVWVIKLIAGYVFDCMIFPLSLFIVLFWLTRLTAKYIFGIQKNQAFKKDIEEILGKYYTKSNDASDC